MKYMKLGSKPDAFQSEGNTIRFVATELATDIIINLGDVKFYLHKFPLLSKSPRLQKLVAAINEESNDEIDVSDIPGGPAAFEICAKFCYGMIVTLNAYNVVAARCAAEYLEMHESIEKGNLIYKIDVFLNSSVFRSWKDSIIVLQSSKSLFPWSEDLKVVSHCIDSIATKASIDPSEVEWSYTYNRKKLPSENGLDQHWNGVRKLQSVPKDWWVEDLCELEMDCYKRVIMAIKTKGKTSSEVIGEALRAYAYRKIPSFSKNTINGNDLNRHRTVLETIVWLLPSGKGSVQCGFLLGLLRAACMLGCGEMCKNDLIKRIGWQLEEASVGDLLVPSEVGECTIYNIDLITSIVNEFLMQNREAQNGPSDNEKIREVQSPNFVSSSSKVAVGKLIDGYLAEIAKDPNLLLSKFVELAEMVSTASRPVHDGLYRAIDMYLKEHPSLSKSEKKRICSLMDCKKLSSDASMHAIQNDRLPLRVVVQVLFFQQVRASAASSGTGGDSGVGPVLPVSVRSLLPRENGNSYGSSRSAATTNTEDDWEGIPTSSDMNSFRSIRLAGKGGGSERSSSGGSDVNKSNGNNNNSDDIKSNNGKAKGGTLMPKKILSKLWSGKGHGGENSNSSDSSESPGSVNPDDTKSTPSRNTRHSVS
ncbi:BTB/POZ domain-containing protein NPY4-like isoform X1 [Ananas comosus]|uniref:BTB/POZ domain-containing protein NPY4-like isoform X1 n=1 Tax=Ananas comosus TaxID=4615 RepID=A0A6P5FHE6_ANACO|nr:BTB/POZ domain-containing protein NPY4-like isoform X1 [Ananas comosus]